MKRTTLLLLLSIIFSNTIAQVTSDSLKKHSASRTSHSVKIDGRLDEDAWKDIPTITDFVMSRPIEGGTPTEKTEVKIVYDNTALYVGAMLYDSQPDSILRELGLRDAIDPANPNGFSDINADNFRIVFDTYNTRQDAYDFTVYASGVQQDSRFSDYTFDAVWESAVLLTKDGWIAEMKIPYSAIRFPKKAVQQWAFQITRNIRRKREFLQWSLTPSTAYNSQLYWANLNGIENVKPPLRLSLTPYLSGSYENAPVYETEGNKTDKDNNTYSNNNAYSYRGGADLKVGLDERFTLDVTLLPDFSQVKSDNKIVTLGYQEITYDENRPFFKEGTDLFSKGNLFYSRRIGATPGGFYDVADELGTGERIKKNPANAKLLNALKLSGRMDNGLGLGIFNAITGNTYAEIDGPEGERKILTEPLTNFNIMVLDKQWKNNASAYIINTNVTREGSNYDANVTGVGYSIANKKNSYATDGSFAYTQQYSGDNLFKDENGHTYFLGARKISGRFQFGASRTEVNNAYDATDAGYFRVKDRIYNRIYLQGFQFKPSKLIREGNLYLDINHSQNFKTKDLQDVNVNASAFASLLDYNAVFGGLGFTPETGREYDPRLDGRFYNSLRYWYGYLGVSTDYRKKFAIDLTQNMSNFVDRFKMEGFNTDLRLRYRINDKLTLTSNLAYYFDPFNFGYVDTYNDTYLMGGRKTNTYITQLSARYIFKNDMSLTLIGREYWFNGKYRRIFELLDNGDYAQVNDDELRESYHFSYNFFNVDLLFSWRFAPGSDLNITYKNIYEPQTNEQYIFKGNNYQNNLEEVTTGYPHTNNISVKVLYYLDYLYLRKKSK
ncbi:MAG TPA: DUF5916 domain-containing protein [Bacteroidia bacterium]|nr:DUF5916 domain-containing protein [Bacteroidia bacterium]HNU34828.1 DUF5916 domain-containing protein [Bacteroidia bacterium]